MARTISYRFSLNAGIHGRGECLIILQTPYLQSEDVELIKSAIVHLSGAAYAVEKKNIVEIRESNPSFKVGEDNFVGT